MTSDISYQAGTCNIGTAEINQRKRIGWLGLLLTGLGLILFFIGVMIYEISPLIGFLIGIPALMAAIGLLQARQKFCVAYGLKHVQNVTLRLGTTTAVNDTESRRKDRNKALIMILQALAIGLATGVIVYFLGVIVSP
jgi:hypothetical protein